MWLLVKNNKVCKAEELNLQLTVLLCVHIVRVLRVRMEVFNLYLLDKHVGNTWVQSPCRESGAV